MPDRHGQYPLDLAATNGHVETTIYLIERMTDILIHYNQFKEKN